MLVHKLRGLEFSEELHAAAPDFVCRDFHCLEYSLGVMKQPGRFTSSPRTQLNKLTTITKALRGDVVPCGFVPPHALHCWL